MSAMSFSRTRSRKSSARYTARWGPETPSSGASVAASGRAAARLRELAQSACDVVLANPPYYAQLSIAELFIQRGRSALKPGGRLFLVTKQPGGVYPLLTDGFGEPEAFERRGYIVFRAVK